MPHKPVVKENSESAKVHIVYDTSVRADNQSKSLNEYLEQGPKVKQIMEGLYVDDLITGGDKIIDVQTLKPPLYKYSKK